LKNEQLTLDIQTQNLVDEDFLVSKSNQAAWKIIKSYPNWDFPLALISGERSCGKTMLGQILKTKFNLPIFDFAQITNINFTNFPGIIIDNYAPTLLSEQEEKLCHLYDEAHSKNKKILLLGKAFDLDKIERSDLKTRLLSSLNAQILPPDDVLGANLILKFFTAHQIEVSPEIINYILQHCERSYVALYNIVENIDALTLKEQQKVTINLIKTLL